jgi:digeranylgeranylglycerophospholipid reductase
LRDFDVVVAGGGCAGLWAAAVASGCGARTLVVEREAEIGSRIRCAEGVGNAGISQFLTLEEDWVAARVNGGSFCSPDGNVVDAEEPGCGFILHKSLFLKGLARKAEESGAEVMTGGAVVGLKPPGKGGFEVELGPNGRGPRTVTCGAVVAADGIESGVARMTGVDTHLAPRDVFCCAQYTVSGIDARPDLVEFHFGNEIAPGGYAWVFPKGEGKANVGVGVTVRDGRGRPSDYLMAFAATRCPGARVERRTAGGVPAVRKPPGAFHGGLFLAGDAGRMADPISGAGIVPALESGALSGEYAALYALGGEDPLEIERRFASKYSDLLKNRRVRFALKKIFTGLTDREFSRVVALIGEFSRTGGSLDRERGRLVKYFMKSMPRNFGMLRHLVGI